MPIAPAVAPDLPLSLPLPALFAPLLDCVELSVLLVDFADASALAEPPAPAEALALLPDCEELSDFALDGALALLSEGEELSDFALDEALALLSEGEELLDFALASLLPPALLEELDELADLPPPVAVSEPPAEPAAF